MYKKKLKIDNFEEILLNKLVMFRNGGTGAMFQGIKIMFILLPCSLVLERYISVTYEVST